MKNLMKIALSTCLLSLALIGCGESPVGPSADVPLSSAEAGWNWNGMTTTQTDTVHVQKKGPTEGTNGYALAM